MAEFLLSDYFLLLNRRASNCQVDKLGGGGRGLHHNQNFAYAILMHLSLAKLTPLHSLLSYFLFIFTIISF